MRTGAMQAAGCCVGMLCDAWTLRPKQTEFEEPELDQIAENCVKASTLASAVDGH